MFYQQPCLFCVQFAALKVFDSWEFHLYPLNFAEASMADKKSDKKTVKRIKTGAIERRFSMAKAGFLAGSRLAQALLVMCLIER